MDIQKVAHISCKYLDDFDLPIFLGSVRFIHFRGCWLFVFVLVRFCLLSYFLLKNILKNRLHTFIIDSNNGKSHLLLF